MRFIPVAVTLFCCALIGAQDFPAPSPSPYPSPGSDAGAIDARPDTSSTPVEEFAPPYPSEEPDWEVFSVLADMGNKKVGWYVGVEYSAFSGTGSLRSSTRRRNNRDYRVDEEFQISIEDSQSLVFGYHFSNHFSLQGSIGNGAFNQSVSGQMIYPLSNRFAMLFDVGFARYAHKEGSLALSATVPLIGIAVNQYFEHSTLQFGFYSYSDSDVDAADWSESVDPAWANTPFNISISSLKVRYLHNFYRDD